MPESDAHARKGKGQPVSEKLTQQRLADISKETLNVFEEVATDARAELESNRSPSASVLAGVNTLTTDRAARALSTISDDRRRDLMQLCEEPAIARVVVSNDAGVEQTIFISRATPHQPPKGGTLMASYRAPMGRLAAIPVGEDHEVNTPGGVRVFEVQERAALRPVQTHEEWDSKDTIIQGREYGPLTVRSLRELLRSFSASREGLDLLQSLIEQDRKSVNVHAGIQRSVIKKIGLRDQPLLDKYQDQIFRLPLDSRLVMLGPPGTGKTTTLIKRLGLKLDQDYLEEGEGVLVERSIAGRNGHAASWLMFTPTELLKQYVKEAFGRENIPASDLRIQTWADYRRDLARNKLGVLRTSTGRGFILRDDLRSLQDNTIEQQRRWYADFEGWQVSFFWSDLRVQAERLSENADRRVAALGTRLLGISVSAGGAVHSAPFLAFNELADEVSSLAASIKSDVDTRLRQAFARELNRDNRLLDDLLALLKTLDESADAVDELDDPDVEDEEDEEDEGRPQRGEREEAFGAFMRAVRAQARMAVSKRSVGRRSRNGRILEWLGSRSLPEAERLAVGQMLQVQTALRRFTNPLQQFFNRLPARYRRFRRERRGEGMWYTPDGFALGELSPLEADAVLLAILRAAHTLLQDRSVLSMIDGPRFATLKMIRELYRTQIVVDEATDFSPLQLACMAALCDPAVQSFLACGDFNQRITEWGTRSLEDLRWVFSDFDIRPVRITYRHSRQLNELARRLGTLYESTISLPELPPHVNSEGVNPVLAKGVDGQAVVDWLAARVVDIERFTKKLPSIAVLVNGEDEVRTLAQALNATLSGQNIRVVACPGGQVVGQESDVRVFDVKHIKGLEFEAVFFVGVDKLATRQPELFDKYLYVGATRAATYLGLTCSCPNLPERIATLENAFVSAWD